MAPHASSTLERRILLSPSRRERSPLRGRAHEGARSGTNETSGRQARGAAKPRGRQRSLEAEAAVLFATNELLKDKPLRDVTTDAIAQRAGVSKATLYKWWPNKNVIALDAFLTHMKLRVTLPNTGSALRDFTFHVKDVMHFFTSAYGSMICQFIAEGQSDPEFLALFRDRFLRARRDEVRSMWERGVQRGELRDDVESDIGLDLIFGPMIYRLLTGHAPLDNANAEALVAVAFRGVQRAQITSKSNAS